jgi:ribonucleotide monophosphatase NagD (HAD superfamily)
VAIDSRPRAADWKPTTVTPAGATVIKALLLDLNGVLYEDGSPYPVAEQTMGGLQRKGYRLRFLTGT